MAWCINRTCKSVRLLLRSACAFRAVAPRSCKTATPRIAPQVRLLRSLGWYEAFILPRAKAPFPETALPGSSYTSGQAPSAEPAVTVNTQAAQS